MRYLRLTIPLTLSVTLASCSMMPAWLGDSDKKKLEGQRITLLKTDDTLRPSTGLEQVTVTLPAITDNNQTLTNKTGHLALPQDISIKQHKSIGKSSKKSYPLPAPVIADGKIFILDGAGTVLATDAQNISKILWKSNILPPKSTAYTIGGGLAYDNGILFATAGQNNIVALTAADGKEIWRKPVSNVVRAAPAAANGKVSLITADNHFYVFNQNDGTLLGTHEGIAESVGILGAASPISGNGILLVPHSSGELLALNDANGTEMWSVNLAHEKTAGNFPLNDIDAAPIMAPNAIYTVSNAGGLFALDPASGNPLWKQEVPDIQSVWAAGDFLYAINNHNEVVCVYAQDGRIKWITKLQEYDNDQKKTDKLIASGPVLAGNALYITLSHGIVAKISPVDGKVISTISINDHVTQAPQVASGKMYLLSNDAKLEVLY